MEVEIVNCGLLLKTFEKLFVNEEKICAYIASFFPECNKKSHSSLLSASLLGSYDAIIFVPTFFTDIFSSFFPPTK